MERPGAAPAHPLVLLLREGRPVRLTARGSSSKPVRRRPVSTAVRPPAPPLTAVSRPIYLDYNATTPVAEPVLEAMLPFFGEHFGNASSRGHAYGWAAEEAVKRAREEVAALLGVERAVGGHRLGRAKAAAGQAFQRLQRAGARRSSCGARIRATNQDFRRRPVASSSRSHQAF